MNKYAESNRKGYKRYSDRMQNAGYHRATAWIPKSLLESLREMAIKEGVSLQEVILQSLKKTVEQSKN